MDGSVVSEIMMKASTVPRATYRLQLHRDFTFAKATEIVPYLAALGISHCYVSPLLKARPGSMHGYDIVDHNQLNPEIGTREEFEVFVNALHEHGMGLIVDIVPNHMGVMGSDNAWWLDVLENGEASPYACYFDIDWHPLKEELHGKILVPVLHDHYGAVLESGELRLVFQAETGAFDISYRSHRFPVNPREYPRILQIAAGKLASTLEEGNMNLLEFQSLITAFGHLPRRQEVSGALSVERNRDKEIHKRRLAELCARSPEIAAAIVESLDSTNGNPADHASFDELHELIKVQAFRLANWRVACDDINYRRFFDTNDLAGLCAENEAVFEATHRLVLSLVAEGRVDGVRVDHPDGLYDPVQYFERLKSHLAIAANESGKKSDYVVIEKILTGAEQLPRQWPVSGTTGYDFANQVNGLFVDASAEKRFERIYHNFTGEETEYDDLAYRSRKLIIRVALASELNVLAYKLMQIALMKRHTCDFTLNSLRDALTEVVASFPVYRTYVSASGVSRTDESHIRTAIAAAKWRNQAADISVFDFISSVLLTSIGEGQDAAYRKKVTTFAMKFQQFTSPVMAKGLEDTAFYRYNRLVSLNEVGGDLHRFGIAAREFHLANRGRAEAWPHTMLATSTHDSKRSEDVRARINVLSEMPALWRLRVREWKRINLIHKSAVGGRPAPSENDEYMLYQILLGAWPSGAMGAEDDWKQFAQRVEAYVMKAIREAKENTSWINSNEPYERAASQFVKSIVTPANRVFLDDFLTFQQRVARFGLWNSLSQTLLKLTSPGVPDIYQGNEWWDFSLVDPDNRRPVDYGIRRKGFESLRGGGKGNEVSSGADLLTTPEDGRLKLYLIWKTLCLRKEVADIFEHGSYLPLAIRGEKADHVVAFVRELEGASVLVIVPRFVATLMGESDLPPTGREVWKDTHATIPSGGGSEKYRNVFTGEVLDLDQDKNSAKMEIGAALEKFPVGLFWRGNSIGSA